MTLAWPEPVWVTGLRAAATDLGPAWAAELGPDATLTVSPGPDRVTAVAAGCDDGPVETAWHVTVALWHLWAGTVPAEVPLVVHAGPLEATVPGWLLADAPGPRQAWRQAVTFAFRGDA